MLQAKGGGDGAAIVLCMFDGPHQHVGNPVGKDGGDWRLERMRCRGGLIIHRPDLRTFKCSDYQVYNGQEVMTVGISRREVMQAQTIDRGADR